MLTFRLELGPFLLHLGSTWPRTHAIEVETSNVISNRWQMMTYGIAFLGFEAQFRMPVRKTSEPWRWPKAVT